MTQTDGVVSERAFAKINLSLHVTGQSVDGFHLLDSLVMFTALGDEITVTPADRLSLVIDGPFAQGLSNGPENLVLQAARLFGTNKGAAITLTKNLPVASGIGGGSADAAATLRALSKLWNLPIPAHTDLVELGADVPVCMTTELTCMRGIGDVLVTLGPTPSLNMVLVNPHVAVSTPDVFRKLASKTNAPMTEDMPDPFNINDWMKWIVKQRNDLETPARAITPKVDDVLNALSSKEGCQVARMSGSGATCFAIFTDTSTRDAAAAKLRTDHPDWWVQATTEAPI